MKLIIEPSQKDNIVYDSIDGIILALDGFSVESVCYFTMEEIRDIKKRHNIEVFVKLNKNFMNEDIDSLIEIMKELDSLKVDGIFFYDLAVLQIKRELNLGVNLVWNQTHMVNNYKTCNYYFGKGVNFALLGKEITLDEILEIINLSKIGCMVEVISKPSVAFSKRHLLTNYFTDLGTDKKDTLRVKEKSTNTFYNVVEDSNGTCFYLDLVTNGTSVIARLFEAGCPYIIMREYGIDNFYELVSDTKKYLSVSCSDSSYVDKYKKLGDSTNFFFKKTIYKVK